MAASALAASALLKFFEWSITTLNIGQFATKSFHTRIDEPILPVRDCINFTIVLQKAKIVGAEQARDFRKLLQYHFAFLKKPSVFKRQWSTEEIKWLQRLAYFYYPDQFRVPRDDWRNIPPRSG